MEIAQFMEQRTTSVTLTLEKPRRFGEAILHDEGRARLQNHMLWSFSVQITALCLLSIDSKRDPYRWLQNKSVALICPFGLAFHRGAQLWACTQVHVHTHTQTLAYAHAHTCRPLPLDNVHFQKRLCVPPPETARPGPCPLLLSANCCVSPGPRSTVTSAGRLPQHTQLPSPCREVPAFTNPQQGTSEPPPRAEPWSHWEDWKSVPLVTRFIF